MDKSLSNKYCQKRLNSIEKTATDSIKTALKRPIQKKAEATSDLIGNKMGDKITSAQNNLLKNYQMMKQM